MKIGFIGLGIMGKPMCKNLLKAGYTIQAYDIATVGVENVAKEGAIPCKSAREAVKGTEVVITMLPNSPQVKEVVLGENGIFNFMEKDSVLIDMSSIAPIASREVHDRLKEKGIKMLDAPVSGGEPKAIDGTLSIMVGGRKEVFEQYRELLLHMGSSAVYCGEIGAGNTTKLANQVIVALNIAACSEAFMLAKKAGVDPECVYQAIRGGLAGSTVMDAKVPMMLAGNDAPGFKINLHIKDLNNALSTGHEIGMMLPLTAQVMEMLQQLKNDGMGDRDHSALVHFYEKISGGKIDA